MTARTRWALLGACLAASGAVLLWPTAKSPRLHKLGLVVVLRSNVSRPTEAVATKRALLRCGERECDARLEQCCVGYSGAAREFGAECVSNAAPCPSGSVPASCWSDAECRATGSVCCLDDTGARCSEECGNGQQRICREDEHCGTPTAAPQRPRRLRLALPSRPLPASAVPMAQTEQK